MMQFSNYPAGVTDAHPHFNPEEVSLVVQCGAEDATVVPSHMVKEELAALIKVVGNLKGSTTSYVIDSIDPILRALTDLKERVEGLEDVSDFACPYQDERLLDVSAEAEWTCPECGQTRHTDTLPEERDPDEEWERRNDR